MFRRDFHILRRLPFVIAWVLIAQTGLAQAAPPSAHESFAALHASLIGAADRTLADALATRPWMQTSQPDTERPAMPAAIQRLDAAVQRVQQLRPLVEPILSREGLPAQMIAVALVESGGQPAALSPKGARGVWQFMPDTARRYGLAVSGERDERVEVVKSTRAAARYLRDLHQRFGDWQLAFAAYNAGELAVRRAMERSGQRSYLGIERFLPVETRNYVPTVVKAMRLFGGELNPQQGGPARSNVLYANAQVSE